MCALTRCIATLIRCMFVHTQKLARIIKFNDQCIHKCILLVLVPCAAVSVDTIKPNKMIS